MRYLEMPSAEIVQVERGTLYCVVQGVKEKEAPEDFRVRVTNSVDKVNEITPGAALVAAIATPWMIQESHVAGTGAIVLAWSPPEAWQSVVEQALPSHEPEPEIEQVPVTFADPEDPEGDERYLRGLGLARRQLWERSDHPKPETLVDLGPFERLD